MGLNNFLPIFNTQGIGSAFFKGFMIFLAVFYFLYALVISRQVKVMDETLKDKYNWLVFLITSIQVTAALILMIFAIFLI